MWGPPVYILLKKRFGWHLDLNWGPLGLKSNALTIGPRRQDLKFEKNLERVSA